ncbi:hypothetical protein Tco_0805972 [Tanacetum coccineum]
MFHGLWWNTKAELRVDCYCDAGFETDRDDTKSQTRYVFILNGGAVDWKSSKQSTTAMSTIEAEYIATSEATMEAVWIRKFSGLVSPASTQVGTASTQVSTANLSDATIYAFLANQPNGSQFVHEDHEQIHEDDLEEMDLKWQLALLSMRTKRFFQKTGRKITINGSDTAGYDKSKTLSSKAMLAIDGAGFDWSYMADDEVPINMALMAFSDSEINCTSQSLDFNQLCLEEFQQLSLKAYGPKFMLDVDKFEKKTVFPTKIEFVKQQEKPVRKPVKYAEMYRSQGPRGNQRNWNNQRPKAVNNARPNTTVVNAVRANQLMLLRPPNVGFHPQPKRSKDSPFDLEAYTDSDYTGASLDTKSTTGGYLLTKAFDVGRFHYLIARNWKCLTAKVLIEEVNYEGVLKEQEKGVAKKEVSAVDPVTTANAPTTTIDELTLA